ncbi:uncharacterized protein LOC120402159 isoform X2 [Mauremys reevesii]|uniref:uncharacterized protein LOC120402159 isoform X2 n=1 Tax=Mauremys reevesii TaxID=260615 RepID=UPI00193EC5DB|nr:uncharacterized protein LOC120402159 isoform X2 [Mauremys reevesii]
MAYQGERKRCRSVGCFPIPDRDNFGRHHCSTQASNTRAASERQQQLCSLYRGRQPTARMQKVTREPIFDDTRRRAERLNPLPPRGSGCCSVASRGLDCRLHSAPTAGLGTPKELQAGSGLSRPAAETPAGRSRQLERQSGSRLSEAGRGLSVSACFRSGVLVAGPLPVGVPAAGPAQPHAGLGEQNPRLV